MRSTLFLPQPRRVTQQVHIGHVRVGGALGNAAPIMVQSMTNTDTADIQGTIDQVFALANAGSEVVRITVNSPEAAAASSSPPNFATISVCAVWSIHL